MQLSDLGHRICVMGPSGSGKSTLASAIGTARDLEVIHLDRLHHRPYSDWQMRPATEFFALHDEAIRRDRWVIDGNYTKCLPQRLERATGLILLDTSTPASLLRYLRRTLFESSRFGGLDGARDSLKWTMIHHIAFVTPSNRRRYAELYGRLQLPKIYLPSMRAVEAFSQNLKPPPPPL